MLKSYQNAFIFLSLFVFMQALVWFHITSCWHMLCCKPIRVFIHVRSHWPVPLWRGWPHASLSPILCTIWQWGLFFFHPFFLSLSNLTAFSFLHSSHLVVTTSFHFSFLAWIHCGSDQKVFSRKHAHLAAMNCSRGYPKEEHARMWIPELAIWELKQSLTCQLLSVSSVWSPVLLMWEQLRYISGDFTVSEWMSCVLSPACSILLSA